jgi:hypothetical protein
MSWKLSLGCALLLAATPPRVLGTRMLPLTIEQLAAQAELVVQGRVVARSCLEDALGQVFTRVELHVLEVWKGNPSSERLYIVQGGGVVGDRAVSVAGQAEFEPGEEVVAYLVRNARGEAVTLGLAQGKFHVRADPATRSRYVSNVFWGGEGHTAAHRPAGLTLLSRPLSLEELKRRTREAAR